MFGRIQLSQDPPQVSASRYATLTKLMFHNPFQSSVDMVPRSIPHNDLEKLRGGVRSDSIDSKTSEINDLGSDIAPCKI